MSGMPKLVRVACAVVAMALLSGCVVEPAYPPYYYHPHYHYWGY